MFFSGDPSNRKRVDLGGRSTKERDRQKLLEQTRLERNRRLWLRQQNLAAIKIQKCFRGRKVVGAERSRVRQEFYGKYGRLCQNVDRNCFGVRSEFLRELLYFFDARNAGDISALVETCRLLQQFAQEDSGNIVGLFAGMDYLYNHALVDYRVKQLAHICLKAIHQNRNQMKNQLFATPEEPSTSTMVLLEAVVLLINPKLPWVCKTVGYLLQNKAFSLFREIILTGKQENINSYTCSGKVSSLERVLVFMISHTSFKPCICPNIDSQWSFSSQILTIPFLWQLFPYLKEVFASKGLFEAYLHLMACCIQNDANVLPNDISNEFPGYGCLLGNILESAGVALSLPDFSFDMVGSSYRF